MMSWVITANVGRCGFCLAFGLFHHVAVDLEDQLAEQRGADRVEARVRLVEQDDVGLQHERPREPGTLAHPARQLVRHLLARASEPDLVQPPHDDVLDLVLALLRVLAQRERDVVVQVHRAEQRAVLEQQPELLAHLEQVVVGHVRDRLAVHEDVALVGVQQPDHVLDADRLTGAGRTEDHRHHPLGQAHVRAAQDPVAPERLVDVDELDGIGTAARIVLVGVPPVLLFGGTLGGAGRTAGSSTTDTRDVISAAVAFCSAVRSGIGGICVERSGSPGVSDWGCPDADAAGGSQGIDAAGCTPAGWVGCSAATWVG